MALDAIFSLSCPCCGAKVPVYSATSSLVVCQYCNSSLIRSGETAVDSGKKNALIEDFSPLQLYTSGTFQGEQFTIIGVIQIQYARGYWKEWYVLFNNGTNGWLADFSGEYVMTRLKKPLKTPLPFERLRAGETQVTYDKTLFVASDIRKATSVKANAQGELPFFLNDDETVYVADFRYRNMFMTLDYSEDLNNPLVYLGKSIKLENLRCQNLRTKEQVIETAGKLKGEKAGLKCPQCGSSVNWYPGVAQNVICPSCHSDISLESGQAQVMRTHTMRSAQNEITTLKIGETARINGKRWTIIGFVRIQEGDPQEALAYVRGTKIGVSLEGPYWHEYLLYNPLQGFLWLVESDGSWDISHTVDTWPEIGSNFTPKAPGGKKNLHPLYAYGGIVAYAAGAFYWRIEPEDVTFYQDYRLDKGKMCAERTRDELNWSISKPVSAQELAQWFNRPELANIIKKQQGTKPHRTFAVVLLIIFYFLNFPAIISALDSGELSLFGIIIVCFVVQGIVWGPHKAQNQDYDDDD